MKSLRTVLLFVVLAFVLSGLFYYLTAGTVVATWQAKLMEIATVAIFIFIVLLIIYIIAKTVVKTTTAITKKRPPQNGSPKV
ncbi:hypothetical protein AM493_16970 [Flavobacterium akiainvivens]|uniref:Uncharacterized protein n=1 Tax=Flavobacterium akiainvivens TaxID=1202724 RepID=A0A0M8MCW9_9FLAO|nr:hypothetical protein [Flavobacterium akiainvivens]KOS07545.1 hypothetical protein AM493_16970 [Flavobacterium akiainvivens]SFQ64330.1 hypothetical protein SAMN05444144_111122 [Flavobacterium akiainvivens]